MHIESYRPADPTEAAPPSFAMDTLVSLYSPALGESAVLTTLPLAFMRVCPLLDTGWAFRISLDNETILVSSDGQGNVGGMNPWVASLESFFGLFDALFPGRHAPAPVPGNPATEEAPVAAANEGDAHDG